MFIFPLSTLRVASARHGSWEAGCGFPAPVSPKERCVTACHAWVPAQELPFRIFFLVFSPPSLYHKGPECHRSEIPGGLLASQGAGTAVCSRAVADCSRSDSFWSGWGIN